MFSANRYLTGAEWSVRRIQCILLLPETLISLPLKSFTIRIFVQFPITTLMFRVNGNEQNVQNITEAVQCPRQPTNSTTRFIYSIPNHDQCYHHSCRGLPSLSQLILPGLFLLSIRQLIIIDILKASNRIISNYSNQQIHKKRLKIIDNV